MHQAT